LSHPTSNLNKDVGICIKNVTREDLTKPDFQSYAYDQWVKFGGLLALRGDDLAEMTSKEFMAVSQIFGKVEEAMEAAREDKSVDGLPILRIGNIRGSDGAPIAQFSNLPMLADDSVIQYNPITRRPVWHTDSTFRKNPPIGSVFHCRKAPSSGGETLFADTQTSFEQIDDQTKDQLEKLEAVCSLAHHDKKIIKYSPEYPVLTPEQRKANPPMRVPLVLRHPVTGKPALYGLNSSTCAVLPKGQAISEEDRDKWDLEGVEDESVSILKDLLPFVTSPEFTVKWTWKAGDVVIWDNRCTIHTGTGFDHVNQTREMWRTILLNN